MNAVIDVGGGLRGIYGSGVFDRFLDDGVYFDLCIGVSAGSANVGTFLARQKGRNYRFFRNYSQRKEYMSFSNLIKRGSYLDLDYVYSTLTNSDGEDPIDFKEIKKYKGKFLFVATDAETGKPHYFTKDDISQDNYEIFKASCTLPIVCKPRIINSREYFDGGLSDPAPLEKAIEEGADKIVLVLTKPVDAPVDSKRNDIVAKLIKHKYPNSAEALKGCRNKYKDVLDKALRMQKDGKVLIVSPDNCEGVGTLTKDKHKLDLLYKKGYRDAEKVKSFLNQS